MEYIINRPFYTKYAWAYDDIIKRPYKKDCDFIEKIFRLKSSHDQLSILDVGCGTGTYALELAQRGFQVTGIDISKEQIAVANTKLVNEKLDIEFLKADMFDLKFKQKFDLVLCRGVLNDIINNKLRLKIFQIFKSLLHKNGVLVFDVRDWENSYKAKSKNRITEKIISLEKGQLSFKSETKFNIALKQLLIKETHILKNNNIDDIDEYAFIMQCWTTDELKYNLENAQFNKFDFYGDYKLDVAYGETEKIIVVAK